MDSITYDDDSYEGTVAAATTTSNMVSGLRSAGTWSGYSDKDRSVAMGQSSKR